MAIQAKASFALKSWDEKTWDGQVWDRVPGRKLTRAQITYSYEGDLQGEGTTQMLTFYRDDGTASFTALEEITGKLGGKSGSFVVQHTGSYANGVATSSLRIVSGSGTGELVGLRGEGTSTAEGEKPSYPISFEYDFE
jgi:hypothetical protein